MKNIIAQRPVRILAMISALTLGATGTASAAQREPAARSCPTAEVFATDNTAIITDPGDPRLSTHLTRFDREVRSIIHTQGAAAGASTLLGGVFWSTDLQQATYERSREFEVNKISPAGLHHVASVIAKRYGQEAVLTFRCLKRTSPDTDAVQIQASGVSWTRLHDALVQDPEARARLGGGSVTLDGRLILVASLADLDLARKFTARLGVDWNKTTIRYGDKEFVS
ncbi:MULTISPECIES: hypothetical protein [unclassified Streptomyces]|uniref:hypothetical protein n=1 Tax=unclassified Streptomyces TaxID=2593676 RepID=UPI002F90CBA0